jgi:RNA-directed DNA polymerase
MGSHQFAFEFADSPSGSGSARKLDASSGSGFLLHTAKSMPMSDPVTPGGDTSRLLERVASPRNLATALYHVASNKGAPGIDGRSVSDVVALSHEILPALRASLLSGTYEPGAVRRVWIPKPGGGQRGLGIPNVIDRVVQQAILQVLEVIYEPTFHNSSHGFRRGRGAHTAIAEARSYVEEGRSVVVDIDLAKFFDRVNHQRLLSRLGQRIMDRRLLKLIGQLLKADVVLPDGVRVSTEEGTPQGGPLSPLLSNIVLDEFDQELSRRGLRFVRYADDCNIFVRSERSGHRVMGSLRRFLSSRLRLEVNTEKSKVARPEEVHFLGFSLWRTKKGEIGVRMSSRTKERLDVTVRGLTPRNWGGSFSSCLSRLNRYLRGWLGYYGLCTQDGASEFKRVDAHIRRRLRALMLVRRKRPRYLYRHLRDRGVNVGESATTAYSRRGPWYKSNTKGINTAYPVRWFRGSLVSLWESWQASHPPPTSVRAQGLLFEL